MASCIGDDDIETDIENLFHEAAEYLTCIADNLNQDALLYFYARYKQVTCGPCNTPAPGFFDFTGKRKWNAWNNLGNMDKLQAMNEYIENLRQIEPEWKSDMERGKQKKPLSISGVSVSTLQCHDEEICEDAKTPFDWVKENNLTKLYSLSENNQLNVNDTDDEGLTYLHWACDRGHTDAATFLLDKGACINAQDNEGLTALHYACSCEHIPLVELLLQRGADRTIPDNDGLTALETASSNEAIVKMLSV